MVSEAKKEIQEINVADLKKMQQSGEDFSLIDLRDKQDADKGMMPQAVNISRGMLEHNIDQVTADKDRKIVLYCDAESWSAQRNRSRRWVSKT
ncbi:MAG TPA: rhodanese-like domain-containing protein [Terriglobales bacterium]|nr:rhodanese-like domain-containing protein [Terriglobales bacterium]